MSYELSTTFKPITTSSRGKVRRDKEGNPKPPLTVSEATGKAKANLSYITRDGVDDADIIFMHNGKIDDGRDNIEKMKTAIDQRGTKHRKGGLGVRVADKIMVSLPNDATPEEHRQMAGKILTRICGSSEAHGLAAIHRDREGNPHLHILFVDGLETPEQARLRRPDAKRIRRQDYAQMSDGGTPKRLRAEFASAINFIGKPKGRNFAEHRSFEERGIERTPQIHEGVEVQQKQEAEAPISEPAMLRIEKNLDIIAKNAERNIEKVPKRWKSAQFFEFWMGKFGFSMPSKPTAEAQNDNKAPEQPQKAPERPRVAIQDIVKPRTGLTYTQALLRAKEMAFEQSIVSKPETPQRSKKRRRDIER